MRLPKYFTVVLLLFSAVQFYKSVDCSAAQQLTSCLSDSTLPSLPRLVCDTQHAIWIMTAYLATTPDRSNPNFCTSPTSDLTTDCVVNVDDVTYDIIRQCATYSIGSVTVNANNYVDRCSAVKDGYVYLRVDYDCTPITNVNGDVLMSVAMDTTMTYGSLSGLVYFLTTGYPTAWNNGLNQCRVHLPPGVSAVLSILDARARLKNGTSQCAYQFYVNSVATSTYRQWCVQVGWRYQDVVLPRYNDGSQTFDVVFNPVISGASEGQLWMLINGTNIDGSPAGGIDVTCGANLILQPVPSGLQTLSMTTQSGRTNDNPVSTVNRNNVPTNLPSSTQDVGVFNGPSNTSSTTILRNITLSQSTTATSTTTTTHATQVQTVSAPTILATSQSVNIPVNPATSQSVNTPINPATSQSVNTSINPATSQSVNTPINPATSQSANIPVSLPTSPNIDILTSLTTSAIDVHKPLNNTTTTEGDNISNSRQYSTTAGYVTGGQTALHNTTDVTVTEGGNMTYSNGSVWNWNYLEEPNTGPNKLGLIIGLSVASAVILVVVLCLIFCILSAKGRRKSPSTADTPPGDLIFAWDTSKLTDDDKLSAEQTYNKVTSAFTSSSLSSHPSPTRIPTSNTEYDSYIPPRSNTHAHDTKDGGGYAEIRDVRRSRKKAQSYPAAYLYNESISVFDASTMTTSGKSRAQKYEQKQSTLPIMKHRVLTPARAVQSPLTAGPPLDPERHSVSDTYTPFEDPSPYGSYFPNQQRRSRKMDRESETSGEVDGYVVASVSDVGNDAASELGSDDRGLVYVNFSSEADTK